MNETELIKFLETENEYIQSVTAKWATETGDDAKKILKEVLEKTKFLADIISCRELSAAEIAKTDLPYATKKVCLEMFDYHSLISEILKDK